MSALWVGLGLLLVVPMPSGGVAQLESPPEMTLCDALSQTGPGEQIRVTLSGVYAASFEQQHFYDPRTPVCTMDVDPLTWVEFSPTFNPAALDGLLKTDHRVQGMFTGVLVGPPALGPDDPSLPPMASFMERNAGRRYGHLAGSRTKFVIESMRDVRAVPRDTPVLGEWRRPRVQSETPRLVAGQLPQYPEMARRLGIEGTVVVSLAIAGGRVQSTRLVSGDRVLGEAVLANTATWQFEAEVSTRLTSTFVFELHLRRSGADPNLEISADLPAFARVSAPANWW